MLDIDCSDERPVEFDAKEILTYFDTLNDAAYRCFCFCVPAQFRVTLQARENHAAADAVTQDPSFGEAAAEPSAGQVSAPTAEHARLARELREATGLPAATLGAALGVTREQYQRWLRGDPISTIRHGLLSYLHTIAADAARRLGPDRARVSWRTPASDGIAPDRLLRDRLTDDVHRLVTALPDPAPIVDEVLVALPAQQLLNLGDYDDLDDEDDPADDRMNEADFVHVGEREYSDDCSSPDREAGHTQA